MYRYEKLIIFICVKRDEFKEEEKSVIEFKGSKFQENRFNMM